MSVVNYIWCMNKLPTAKRVQILSMLCEGSSMRSISRVCDVSINTVSKPLEDAGKVCMDFHDENVRHVVSKRVQMDEIWSFTAAKQKNVAAMKMQVLVDDGRSNQQHAYDFSMPRSALETLKRQIEKELRATRSRAEKP